ncbi:MAG TPA: ferrous iron transport protein B [Desulfurococcales archaeon]|nr:ferrous iron transport protein B [Desulfurococcales archaeon]
MEKKEIIVAVAGNPNVGKSTLFNVLTGKTVHVANWPGVTVELKQGVKKYRGKVIKFVDLPGAYGISASTMEELIAREFIVHGEPDVVLVLADSTAPERTLYLPIQILELTPKVVVALTKSDLTHKHGVHIYVDKLESILKVPVIPVSAIKGYGIRELLNAIIDVASGKKGRSNTLVVDYNGLEPFIKEVESYITKSKALSKYPSRWAAVRLLEGDSRLEELMEKAGEKDILDEVRKIRDSIKRSTGKDPSEIAITSRFNYVDSIVKETVVRAAGEQVSVSELLKLLGKAVVDQLERIFQHTVLGPIASLLLLFLMFLIIFTVNTGFPVNVLFDLLGFTELAEFVEAYSLAGLVELTFEIISSSISMLLEAQNVAPWIISLITDGIIAGIGAVLTFLPLIMFVSFFLAVLEDSGIAPRIAVAFNNIFVKFGLTGRAIYPYLISIGCNTPGILASRTSIEEEERMSIIGSASFVPCQARLVVILAFVTTYFKIPLYQAAAVISIYLMAFLVTLTTALFIRRVIFRKKEKPELILELPPIHKPSLKVVWWLTWSYSKHFLKKAGTIIFLVSVLTWFMINYGPTGPVDDISQSYGAIFGRLLSPFLTPFHINPETSWKVAYALINGFIAKECLVETIVLLEGGDIDVDEALLALGLTRVQTYSLLVFMTLYVPCLATLAVIYMESRSVKFTLGITVYIITVAYLISLIVYYILSLTTLYLIF